MATENAAIYNSAGNASNSMKLSGNIPVVILSHFELSESRSCDLAAILDSFWKCYSWLWLLAAAFIATWCSLETTYALGTLVLALGTLHRPIFGCGQHLVLIWVSYFSVQVPATLFWQLFGQNSPPPPHWEISYGMWIDFKIFGPRSGTQKIFRLDTPFPYGGNGDSGSGLSWSLAAEEVTSTSQGKTGNKYPARHPHFVVSCGPQNYQKQKTVASFFVEAEAALCSSIAGSLWCWCIL